MVGRNALVVELYMRVLGLAKAHRVVVLQYGAVRRLVLWFFELELYDAFIDVLNGK